MGELVAFEIGGAARASVVNLQEATVVILPVVRIERHPPLPPRYALPVPPMHPDCFAWDQLPSDSAPPTDAA